MKTKNIYIVLLAFAGLFLFTARSADAFTSVTAQGTYEVLVTDPNAVMFDVRTVEEYYGCERPYVGSECPDPDLGNQGTAKWGTSNGLGWRLPFNVPFWHSSTQPLTSPENPEKLTETIEALLAVGIIDFDTPIYLICIFGWRSFYMAEWIEAETFYNALTGTTDVFTNLFVIDADGDPGNGFGGMYEWTATGLPKWLNGGDVTMPPQVISSSPQDGASSTASANFTVTILEPYADPSGPFISSGGYAAVTSICVDIAGVANSCLTGVDLTPGGVVANNYNLNSVLPGTCGDSYTWTSYATGTSTNYSPNAWGSGVDDTRTLTIGPIPGVIINSSVPLSVSVELDAGDCAGTTADWYVYSAVNPYGPYYYKYPPGSWSPGSGITYSGPLFDLPPFNVLNMTLSGGTYTFCFDIDMGTVYSDCATITF